MSGSRKRRRPVSNLIEQGQRTEAVPGIPARIGQRDFALRLAQALLEGKRAGGDVTDFELLDERPRAQAPFPGCKRH